MRVYAIGKTPPACCAVKNQKKRENINFNGFKMHLLDCGEHADTMLHFAKAIGSDIANYTTMTLHEIEPLTYNKGLKSLFSLDKELTRLDAENIVKPNDFVAIPCTAPIELNELSHYYNRSNSPKENFTPQNVKSKRELIIKFLENNPSRITMDKDSQGFQYLGNIIKTINNMVKKGVNVYIPADHPLEAAIKWHAKDRGLNNALYKYIATGNDEGGKINAIIKELKSKNAYKFNLLTLSDAHIVNLQNRLENGDYIFSAYDSCVTDRARGVYNFYPVRDRSGNIQGFSFTDRSSIHYTVTEYAGSQDIADIAQFVGLKTSDFSYEGNLIRIMQQLISWEEPINKMPNILYPVGSIYSPKRLREEKIAEKGLYVDRTEKLFFDKNNDNEFIFRKCDCEGSGRPSVVSMWGNCFATINFMTKSVRAQLKNLFEVKIPRLLQIADESEQAECYPAAENILKKALELSKPEVRRPGFRTEREYEIYTKLYSLYVKQGRADDAEKLVYEAFPDGNENMYKYIREKVAEMRKGIANDKT